MSEGTCQADGFPRDGFFSAGAQAAVDGFLADRNGDGRRYDFEVADEAFGRFATLRRLP